MSASTYTTAAIAIVNRRPKRTSRPGASAPPTDGSRPPRIALGAIDYGNGDTGALSELEALLGRIDDPGLAEQLAVLLIEIHASTGRPDEARRLLTESGIAVHPAWYGYVALAEGASPSEAAARGSALARKVIAARGALVAV